MTHRRHIAAVVFAFVCAAISTQAQAGFPNGKKLAVPVKEPSTTPPPIEGCVADRQANAIISDDRGTRSLRCKLEVAAHNLALSRKQGQVDRAFGWEAALRRLEVDDAQAELARASGSVKAAAALNAAIAAAEAIEDRVAAKARAIAITAKSDADARVRELETKTRSATGKAKDEARARSLAAQKVAKLLEQKLGELDVVAAKSRLELAKKRVGAHADELLEQGQAKLDAAQRKAAAATRRIAAAIAQLQQQIDELERSLPRRDEKAEQLRTDAEQAIDDALQDLGDLL